MKKVLPIFGLLIVTMLLASLAIAVPTENPKEKGPKTIVFEKIYKLLLKLSLPKSLDKYYKGSEPEVVGNEYLGEMFKLSGFLNGIIVNIQGGDFANAENSFNAFSVQYDNISKMVPRWKEYFYKGIVAEIGHDIKDHNVPETFKDIAELGEKSCDRCHRNNKGYVWANFYWRNFDTVNISTPEGPLPWPMAKAKYLAIGFDGATINLAEGKRDQANASFDLFNKMFHNLKTACSNCHDTPRYYFVSNDVMSLVDKFGDKVKSGNLTGAQVVQGQIGEQCMKCHIVHEPNQRIKEMIDLTKRK